MKKIKPLTEGKTKTQPKTYEDELPMTQAPPPARPPGRYGDKMFGDPKLARTSDKDHILKEARELFYDREIKFLDLLDSNPYLMCFKNGVWDFKEKVFRAGRAEDYISKCTNIDYRKLDTARDAKIISEINDFMAQISK